jgi:hypothetical protein
MLGMNQVGISYIHGSLRMQKAHYWAGVEIERRIYACCALGYTKVQHKLIVSNGLAGVRSWVARRNEK